ncbi:MAG TPA: RtcB family protein, partial [Clostridia bacterium]|nr:RtcB family protein [Clostridia bacterium]
MAPESRMAATGMQALDRISETLWEIPVSYKEGMRVPARIFATEKLVQAMDEAVFEQVTNVATLPGITQYAFCMPDGHSGYGFPIGGVAAMDVEKGGVISPGGIGFDINCGMRLVVTNLTEAEVRPKIKELVDALFQRVPAGVGSSGFLRVSQDEFRKIIEEGARWCVARGYGWEEDLAATEEEGCIAGADGSKVSGRAVERGYNQIGTLGSGNHYLEIQVARKEHFFDPE